MIRASSRLGVVSVVAFSFFGAACSSPKAPAPSAAADAGEAGTTAAMPSSGPSAQNVQDASVAEAQLDASAAPPAPPKPSLLDVAQILFADASDVRAPWSAKCTEALPEDARLRCLYDVRYGVDPRATSLAHGLFVRHGIVAGVEPAQRMDGGWRGPLKIVPTVPVNADRRHLAWMETAFADFEKFFDDLVRGAEGGAPRYRWRPITLRFMKSFKCDARGNCTTPARTPSAYATRWTIAYHLDGSLNTSEDAVRETMFHEIFHLNDEDHGEFSQRVLGPMSFDKIVAKCGTRVQCLAPYAPNDTMVASSGNYYAFQTGNGVREYGAELAVRYYKEQRAALRGEAPKGKRFKCGPPENRAAWDAFVAEFFAGIDRGPPCP